MIRIQQKVLFICMMSNIVLNFGLAFGNVEEELVPGKYEVPISTKNNVTESI